MFLSQNITSHNHMIDVAQQEPRATDGQVETR